MDDFVVAQTFEASSTGKVTVRSGLTIPVWISFRCLYCGEYFSQGGAETHFGITRIEFCKLRKDHGRKREIERSMLNHNRFSCG